MKKLINKIGLFGTVAILLVVACSFISGTWVLSFKLVDDYGLNYYDDFYYASVDLTEEEIWSDHVEHLKDVNMLGFELWAVNNSAEIHYYSAYIAGQGSTLSETSTRIQIEDPANGAILVMENVPIGATPDVTQFISYGSSLKYMRNVDKLKALLEKGEMKVFAYSEVGNDTEMFIDQLNAVLTFTAGY